MTPDELFNAAIDYRRALLRIKAMCEAPYFDAKRRWDIANIAIIALAKDSEIERILAETTA